MKRNFSKLDKLGVGIFIIILINFVFLLDRYDLFNFSNWKYVQYSLFLTLVAGTFLIVKSSWCKLIALLLSITNLILLFNKEEFYNAKISYLLAKLPHFIANGTFSISEIFYFILFPVFIALYCVFEIAVALTNKARKKVSLK